MLRLIKYLFEQLKESGYRRADFERIDRDKIKFEDFIKRHPKTLIVALGCVCLVAVASFLLHELKPVKKCSYLDVGDGGSKLYSPDGDNIKLGDDRECSHNLLAAIEVFNRDEGYVLPDAKEMKKYIVSSGLYFRTDATPGDKGENLWQEYSIFFKGNDFTWHRNADAKLTTMQFVGNTCQKVYDPKTRIGDRQERQGILLDGDALRAEEPLTHDQRMVCWNADQDKPYPAFCKFDRLQLFIPSLEPVNWCAHRTWLDSWLNPGVKRIQFSSNTDLQALRSVAKERSDPTKVRSVPGTAWDDMTSYLPKLCYRRVKPDGSDLGGNASNWKEIASIAAVWCDRP